MSFQDTPIRRKLTSIILATCGVVLLLTCAAFVTYEVQAFRDNALRRLSTIGEIIASNSTAALAFDNSDDAMEVLAAVRADEHVVTAALYDKSGRRFASYRASSTDESVPATAPDRMGYRFEGGFLIGVAAVVQSKGPQQLGTLYLRYDLKEFYGRLLLYGGITVLVLTISLFVAYLLSHFLQRQISQPILDLADTAKVVSDQRDYSVRARKHGADEIGLLTEAFNHMLERIESQNAELEHRVRERTHELEAANTELEAFCSSAAHDLRTPIRAISGLVELLLKRHGESLPADAQRQLAQVAQGSAQMSQLIASLLEFSRLGRQALRCEPIDLAELCHEAFAALEADRTGRRVEFRVSRSLAANGDRALLQVALTNLVSNALKYSRHSDPAVIEVGCALQPEEASPVFFVRDNGVGFDPENARDLFTLFKRMHHSHEFEGTGVGLATARRIIERHGGRIWVEAAPGLGATFFFTIPANH